MVVSRRLRVVLAAALTCAVVFFTFHSGDALYDLRQPNLSPERVPAAAEIPQDDTTTQTDKPDDTVAARPVVKLPPSAPKLVADAHKLPTADSFRDHFSAVMRLKNVTVAEAKAACIWADEGAVDFQYDADAEWVVHERSDDEIALRRGQWQSFVQESLIPWSDVKNKFSGRGIVALTGNTDTTMRLKVVLRRLRVLKSTIPVEVHYWDDELSRETMDELASIYQPMTFNDLAGKHNIQQVEKDAFQINYQLKTAAMVNSRFAELFLLDSDNVPVLDPASVFDSKVYETYHTVFWPDIARTRPQNPAWAITNTPCRTDEYELESGQMAVDKRRYWYHLQLAAWLNNEQAGYYDGFLLGDKDLFRFAWHALKTDYGKPKKWLTSVGAENEGYYCGHSFAQHYPDDGRVAFMHGGLVKSVDKEVMRWNKEVKGGYFRHYKRADTDEDPNRNVRVGIKFDNAGYWKEKPEGLTTAMCTDMGDVQARDLDEILPGWEEAYEAVGGFWQLEGDGKGKASGAKADA